MKINIMNVVKIRAAMQSVHANDKGEIIMVAHTYSDIRRLAFYSELELSEHIPAKLMRGIKIRQQKTLVGDNESMGLCTEAVIERGAATLVNILAFLVGLGVEINEGLEAI